MNRSNIVFPRIEAVANNPVLYSIVGAAYWENKTTSAVVAKNNKWAIKTKSEASTACITAERYPFPRNLFCIIQSGSLVTTSLFHNRLPTFSHVILDVLAADSRNATNNSTLQIVIGLQPNEAECKPMLATINGMLSLSRCSTSVKTVYAVRIRPQVYQFTAPVYKSLLTQIGIRPSKLANLKMGSSFSYTFNRTSGISFRTVPILVPAENRVEYGSRFLNSSLYRDSIALKPGEKILVTVSSHANASSDRDIQITTVPDRDYCLDTFCFDSYNKVVRSGGKLAPKFHCRPLDQWFYDGTYGRCYGMS